MIDAGTCDTKHPLNHKIHIMSRWCLDIERVLTTSEAPFIVAILMAFLLAPLVSTLTLSRRHGLIIFWNQNGSVVSIPHMHKNMLRFSKHCFLMRCNSASVPKRSGLRFTSSWEISVGGHLVVKCCTERFWFASGKVKCRSQC